MISQELRDFIWIGFYEILHQPDHAVGVIPACGTRVGAGEIGSGFDFARVRVPVQICENLGRNHVGQRRAKQDRRAYRDAMAFSIPLDSVHRVQLTNCVRNLMTQDRRELFSILHEVQRSVRDVDGPSPGTENAFGLGS